MNSPTDTIRSRSSDARTNAVLLIIAGALATSGLPAQGIEDSGRWIVRDGGTDQILSAVHFADAKHGLAVGSFGVARLSRDGGYTWTGTNVGTSQSLMSAFALDAERYFAARRPLFGTSDAGGTWTELADPNIATIQAIHFFDSAHGLIINGGHVMRTSDGGTTWEIVFPSQFEIGISKLRFPAAETGYAIGGKQVNGQPVGSVLRTDDAGLTWTDMQPDAHQIVAGDFDSVEHGLVYSYDNQLRETGDGGTSWTIVPTDWPFENDTIIDLRARDAQHWYASTLGGLLLETRDMGRTWQVMYQDQQQRPIAAISPGPGAARAVGNGGLILFEDGLFASGYE